MFQIELSHTFSILEWSCPVTRTVDLAFVERAIRRDSRTRFMCSIPGCHHEGPATAMLNIDRTETDGVVVILCPHHAGEMEASGHRCFWLDRTLAHAVRGFQEKVEAAVQYVARSRPRTNIGRALAQACRSRLARVA